MLGLIFFFFFLVDYGSHPQHWLLFDRIVQQIVLQSESNETGLIRNPDVAPIEINVKEIVHLLAKEEELVAARKKAEELERENLDMSTRLAKKEQELDLRTQEKVRLKITSILFLGIRCSRFLNIFKKLGTLINI